MAVAAAMGTDFEEVRYLKTPPDEATLRAVVAGLEDPVENLVRKDSHFAKLGLDEADYVGNPDAVVAVLLQHPKLMQRPVLVRGGRAIIGRPLGDARAKERVEALLA